MPALAEKPPVAVFPLTVDRSTVSEPPPAGLMATAPAPDVLFPETVQSTNVTAWSVASTALPSEDDPPERVRLPNVITDPPGADELLNIRVPLWPLRGSRAAGRVRLTPPPIAISVASLIVCDPANTIGSKVTTPLTPLNEASSTARRSEP